LVHPEFADTFILSRQRGYGVTKRP
jgi:hypothetical protein